MSEYDKERVLRTLRLLDNMRLQLSKQLCKLTSCLAESEMEGLEDIITLTSSSIEQVTTAMFIIRYKLIKVYCSQYPGFYISEAEMDCYSPSH